LSTHFMAPYFMFSPMGLKNWNVVFFVYWYKDLGKQLLTRSFLLQMSFTLCESKIFISKIHGGPYIVDYEGLELKETWNYVLMWIFVTPKNT